MPKFPNDPTLPTLPGTIPFSTRFKLRAIVSDHDSNHEETVQLDVTRELLLRAKQLLLQLKQLHSQAGISQSQSALSTDLAMLRLTIRSLEQGELMSSHLSDARLVLEEIGKLLSLQSEVRQRDVEYERRRIFLTDWFLRAIDKDTWPLDDIRQLAGQLYREYLSIAPALFWYQATPDEPFRWAASHGLNTAQVLQRMLHPARYSSKHIHNAMLAGLLHDLGMARLPVKVLCAQESTNTTTRQQWRHHAQWLAERLRPHLKPEEFDVALAIAQHHERLDGTGYPAKLHHSHLLELGKQLAIADTYAALCQDRPHRVAYSTRQATQLVLKEAQVGRLDTVAALLLLPWGLAPVGSSVELSDGSIGEVLSWERIPTGTNAVRPIVALAPRQENEQVLDLDLVRDRHIVRILHNAQKRPA